MEIEAFRDWTEIIPEWERLQREHSAPTPFLSYQWLSTWWKHFGNPKELLTLLIKDKEENLIGIVPLSIKEGKTELLGDQSLCDYQDILFQKGSEKPCLSLLLDYLSKSSKLPLYIHSLPGFSPLFQLQREENQCRISEAGTTPIIYLPSSYDEYLLSLGPKQRHEIRRKIIRIEKEGEIDFYSTGAHQSLGQFLKLHKSSKEKAEFMTPKIEQFFYEVATLFSKQGWLKLFFLTFNKKEIASLLCFQLDRTLYLYNSGYDQEYRGLSPGIVIIALTIRSAIEQGFKEFNLLRGSERYKYDFGARDLKIYNVTLYEQIPNLKHQIRDKFQISSTK